jgi:DNA-binding protein HU-beta
LRQLTKTVIFSRLQYKSQENKMNKAELVAAIAKKGDQSQVDTNKFVDGFCEAVMEALANGDQVALVGFGTFKINERAARKGRNPRTGESIDIAASKSPKFTVGKIFKDKVASSKVASKKDSTKKSDK